MIDVIQAEINRLDNAPVDLDEDDLRFKEGFVEGLKMTGELLENATD